MSTSRSGTCDLHEVADAGPADADAIAALAAQTFPLACPPSVAAEHVAAFIAAHLSAARFGEYLSDPQRSILAARREGRIVGYAMLIRDQPAQQVELSKLYTLAEYHGTGVAAALMEAAVARAAEWGAQRVWLGVNQENQRAQRFYAKAGFTVTGTRSFRLGPHLENDYVMTRELG